jgi:uncharacterized phage protein (TIGR02218 family)
MKAFPFDLESAENVARLVTIVRGSETIRFTDADHDITIGSDTWTSEPSVTMSAMEFYVDGTVSNADIQINHRDGGPISDADIAIGRYDGAAIQIAAVDTGNPALGSGIIFTGVIGATSPNIGGLISITVRGPLTNMRGERSERYGPMCRADLGDERCRVPLFPPDIQRSHAYVSGDETLSFVRVRVASTDNPSDYNNLYFECTASGTTAAVQPGYSAAVAGSVVNDGSAQFTARNAWVRYAAVDQVLGAQAFTLTALPDPRAVDDWFILGSAILRSGRYSGTPLAIRKWTAAELRVDSFFIVQGIVSPGDLIEIHRGCAKTQADCQVFNAIKNRRAEPFIPGTDALTTQA